MAIAFVAAGSIGTGSTMTPGLPTGYAEGNLLVLVTTGTATPTTPTGWTQRYAQGAGRFVTVFTKYAVTTEASITITTAGSTGKSAILCYSGAGSYDVVGTVATGSSTSAATTSQTTTYANDYVLSIFARTTTGSTFTVPAGTTSRVNSSSTVLFNGLLLVDELQAAAGASAVRTSTLSVSGAWAAINISFVPTRTLYWVGGTGTWDTTTTGNWANTSGGTPGTIKPPVANEIVNIDTSSGTGTITCTAGVCGDLSVTASQAIILGAASSALSVFGNLTFPSGGSFSASTNAWTITMAGTSAKTITTNGKSLRGIDFNGVGGNWTLPSAITATSVVSLTNGTITLSTNTTTFTCLTFNSSNSNARAIAFGTGQIILTGNNATVWNNVTSTNYSTTGTVKIVSTPTTFSGTRTFALSTTTGQYTVGSGSGNQISFGTTGGDTLVFTGILQSLDFGVVFPYLGTWAQGTNALTISTGNLTLSTGMTCTASTGVITFSATSGTQIVTSAGKTINPVTKVGVGGTLRLADTMTLATTGTFTLTSGALDLGTNNATLSCGLFTSSNANTRSIAFGTSGNITTTGSGTVWETTTTTSLTNSGTTTVNISNSGFSAITVNAPTVTVTGGNFSYNFTTGNYTLTIPTATFIRNLNFTGFAGTWAPGTNTYTFTGAVFTLASGMTFTTNTGLFTFDADLTINLGGKTIGPTSFSTGVDITLASNFTSNSTMVLSANNTFNLAGFTTSGITAITTGSGTSSPGITISNGVLNCASFNNTQTQDITISTNSAIVTSGAFTYNGGNTTTLSIAATGAYITCGGLFTLTNGTLNLGNNTLTTSTFSSSNNNTRSITFGSGSITTTGNGTVWSMANTTGFTRTNTPIINISGGASKTIDAGSSVAFTESNALSFNITGGTTFNVLTPSQVGSLNFTGFTGTWSPGIDALTFYGNLTLVSGMTFTTGSTAWILASTSSTQTITSAGKTLFGITQTGGARTVTLADALTLSGTYTLTNGTFNANNQNVTVGGFSSSNSNIRTITMGSGTWTLASAGTIWNLATTTNLTFNKDTANIVTSSVTTSARTFAGGGLTYNNLTIGGATGISTFTFTGANTFATLASTKTVAHTIVFPNSTTTVSDWTITGTPGNVVTLTRTGASGTFTLAKAGGGIISGINYLTISNSTATPSSTWYAGANSTDGGGNTGWIFANFGVTSGNYFLLF